MEFIKEIQKFIKKHLHDNDIFEKVMQEILNNTSEKIVNNIQDLKEKYNKKKIGDYFEAFCYLYLTKIQKHNVWFYKDFPFKDKLNLTKTDYGIDLISLDDNNNYCAIQCKFRKNNNKNNNQIIPWKSLSTFYGIVYKTGPWYKHVVITNVNGCKHIGKKTDKDWTIAFQQFKNLNRFDWIQMIDNDYIEPEITNKLTIEELRNKRLEFYRII